MNLIEKKSRVHLFFFKFVVLSNKNKHNSSMRNILVIGAWKSCSYLIDYLQKKASSENLQITIADISLEKAQKSVGNHSNSKAIQFDVFNKEQRINEIQKADIVVSMLPARFHIEVAKNCIELETVSKKLFSVPESCWDDSLKRTHQSITKNSNHYLNKIIIISHSNKSHSLHLNFIEKKFDN